MYVPDQKYVIKWFEHHVIILVNHEGTKLEKTVTFGKVHIINCELASYFFLWFIIRVINFNLSHPYVGVTSILRVHVTWSWGARTRDEQKSERWVVVGLHLHWNLRVNYFLFGLLSRIWVSLILLLIICSHWFLIPTIVGYKNEFWLIWELDTNYRLVALFRTHDDFKCRHRITLVIEPNIGLFYLGVKYQKNTITKSNSQVFSITGKVKRSCLKSNILRDNTVSFIDIPEHQGFVISRRS